MAENLDGEFVSMSELRSPCCAALEKAWECEGIYETEDQRQYDTRCLSCGKPYEVTVVHTVEFYSPPIARSVD